MGKVKILGVTKSPNRSYFILDKKQEFVKGFRQFLIDLGFTGFYVDTDHFGRTFDKSGNIIYGKDADISRYVDEHFYFQYGQYNIDLVTGKNKMFLTIYSKTDKQKKISKLLGKFCVFETKKTVSA